jgi:methionyl-tRNA formyltransferase
VKITVLAGRGQSSFILINRLIDAGYRELDVIFEAPPSRKAMLRNRARRLGWMTAFGQLLFIVGVAPVLRRRAARRVSAILEEHGLRADLPDPSLCRQVASVNDPEVVAHLAAAAPDVVLVNGTRIIRTPVLEATPAPFINTHVGITPRYRGVHGGYWALWSGDAANFGVTVHLVDKGVDTGQVLYQARPAPTDEDDFATYPVLQQAASFPGLLAILADLSSGRGLSPRPASPESGRQWYHPTIVQYLGGRLRGVA